MGFYSTVNGGLLVFLGSNFLAAEAIVQYVIPIIGMVLCISWITSLIRVREYRDYAAQRIKKIETALHLEWGDVSIQPADLRTLLDWDEAGNRVLYFGKLYEFFRNFPSSLSLLLLPVAFLVSWAIILVLTLF